MLRRATETAGRLYDALEAGWTRLHLGRGLATLLVMAFLGALVLIEMNRHLRFPGALERILPTNHFGAVDFAFTVLLVFEVLGLVWALVGSFANSVGKQFELLALILIRKAFLQFGSFGEPIVWARISDSVLHMLADMGGALLLFVLLGFYYRFQRHLPITDDAEEQTLFVGAKKVMALVLLAVFVVLGAWKGVAVATGRTAPPFFESFYTVLIFADVGMALVSLRCSSRFDVVFRNSGFAAATVMIRLALTAPPYLNVLLALGGALFAVGLTLAYNHFGATVRRRGEEDRWRPPPAPDLEPAAAGGPARRSRREDTRI